MENTKGFTLIELLVVIAIIAMLSSVILGALGTARNKGNDAAVKESLVNLRSQAQLLYDTNNGNYSGICTTDTKIAAMMNSATQAGSGVTVCATGGGGSFTSYAVQTPLKTGGYWCVDSTGASRFESSALPGGAFACQ